ncbi:hypothetical protein AWW66_19820 [Micromonospora rosaria]|uniref:DUF4097 domain-containing protein n=1 Tax=Micromonospora rosaria TaxID=47874 RepID=A0A136PPI9_9ACTN|nr:DUF4097 family beta strand repeat-containing protein [Micromonospora rosaria]KXK60247.1 hypothetical protein AWW66_19820 [Micromonospora rosaria]
MPTFDTPGPITVTLDLLAADVRITPGDRTDTTVEVRPSHEGTDADVRAAEQTRVEFTDGHLVVRMPKRRGLGLLGRPGTVDLTIALPTGSRLHADAAAATIRATGQLGECRLRTAAGDLALHHTGALDASASAGEITVDRVDGSARVASGSGQVRVGAVGGDLAVRTSNGDTTVGSVAGDLEARSANGDIVIARATGTVTAATANGDLRVDEAVTGRMSLRTNRGEVVVGVPAGTAAHLDLHTRHGRVENDLASCAPPPTPAGTVEVTARTSFGDIVIRRR